MKTEPWRWRCHLCYRIYHFSATSRCLYDGHRFRLRGRCRSCCEQLFDWDGWSRARDKVENGEKKQLRNCWSDCNYPCHCSVANWMDDGIADNEPDKFWDSLTLLAYYKDDEDDHDVASRGEEDVKSSNNDLDDGFSKDGVTGENLMMVISSNEKDIH